MQVEVTRLTRRGAALMRRPQSVTAASIRFGRGSGNEVPLSDLRVDLAAAELEQRNQDLFISALGDSPLRVNGQSATAAVVHPGDEILIGPYKVVIADPPEGFDAALSVELVQPMGDALQRLTAQTRLRLDQTHLNKRSASWALFIVLVLLCLAVPVVAYQAGYIVKKPAEVPDAGILGLIGMAWNPGELSNQHRYFASHCATCHQGAFTEVKDSACLTCHGEIGNHFEASADVGAIRQRLQQTRCADCHEEHRGAQSLVIGEAALCIGCHRSLDETAPKATIRDVGGFPTGHPQFRATVVADAAKPLFTRVDLDGQPKPADHPNLKFNHARHLDPALLPKNAAADFNPTRYRQPLVCADCHLAEPSGQGFLAPAYAGQCKDCHDLRFGPGLPWQEAPHGNAELVTTMIAGFYSRKALEGGVEEPAAPEIVRRVPGAAAPPLTEAQRQDALGWAQQKTEAALDTVMFDKYRGCAKCHEAKREGTELKIAPVLLRTRFLPYARFDHSKHQPEACVDCHAAGQSNSSSDVLIPGIERCITCHGAENTAFRAQSTCTSCHVFHRQEFGPMRRFVAVER
jgi:predicted CXXCH cytochrome family protein